MGERGRSARWHAIHKLGGELKAFLAAHRIYGREHHMVAEMGDRLHAHLTEDLAQHEELTLEVSSLALSFEGRPIIEAEEPRESLSHPLSLDGVQRMVFRQGLSRSELGVFANVWSHALEGNEDSITSFVTDFWEAELEHVTLGAVESFYEGRGGEENVSANRLDVLIEQLASRLLPQSEAAAQVPLLRITREDLLLLQRAGVTDRDADELRRQDAAPKAQAQLLDPRRAERFAALLEIDEVGSVLRFVRALLGAAAVAEAQAREAACALVLRLCAALAERGHLEVLRSTLELLANPREAPGGLAMRAEILVSPAVLDPILGGLAQGKEEALCCAVLALAPREAAGPMLDRLIALEAGTARNALADVIARLGPAGHDLASRMPSADAVLAVRLLDMARTMGDDDRQLAWRAALTHSDAAVRLFALTNLAAEDYRGLRGSLFQLLHDSDPRARSHVLNMVVRQQDRSAIIELGERMESADDEERRRLSAALARLGGSEAGAVLRVVFERERNATLRATFILAIARAEGAAARPLLEQHARKRLFGSREVRDAALAALERLDAPGGARWSAQPAPMSTPVISERPVSVVTPRPPSALRRDTAPPTSEAELCALAEGALQDGEDLDGTCALLGRVVARGSENVRLYELLAEAQERAGRLDEAMNVLHQAVLIAPERADLAEKLFRLRARLPR